MAARAKKAGEADEPGIWRGLLEFALGLPEAWEDNPWGERVAKVRKKVFVFGGVESTERCRVTVKLTGSHEQAMTLPGAEATGYGLGKAGWVTVPVTAAPVGVLEDFVEESYRNVAPKRLSAQLDVPAS